MIAVLAWCAAGADGRGKGVGVESRRAGEAGGGGGGIDVVAERTGGARGGGGSGLVSAGRARIAATIVESGASERGLILGGGAGESFGGWA